MLMGEDRSRGTILKERFRRLAQYYLCRMILCIEWFWAFPYHTLVSQLPHRCPGIPICVQIVVAIGKDVAQGLYQA